MQWEKDRLDDGDVKDDEQFLGQVKLPELFEKVQPLLCLFLMEMDPRCPQKTWCC